VAERLGGSNGVIDLVLRLAYNYVSGAIVMTNFNRRDPEALVIGEIAVIPHRLPDENPEAHLPDFGNAKCGMRNAECGPASHNSRPASPNEHPTFNILYAGHLYDQKGTPELVEAFAEIAPVYPNARLVLMGEFLPPYSEEACRERCTQLDIGNRVEITGVLRGEKKVVQFRSAHLFIFPSVAPYESFGLVLVEAMMWGLPILATEWRGNRDVAGPHALYATVDGSLPKHLAARIEEALAHSNCLAAMSSVSRARYEAQYRLDPSECDYRDFVRDTLHRAVLRQ
jgi:glycosyltransferase involved in cell wall biosynthesis